MITLHTVPEYAAAHTLWAPRLSEFVYVTPAYFDTTDVNRFTYLEYAWNRDRVMIGFIRGNRFTVNGNSYTVR